MQYEDTLLTLLKSSIFSVTGQTGESSEIRENAEAWSAAPEAELAEAL